jgi:hypothetical protein
MIDIGNKEPKIVTEINIGLAKNVNGKKLQNKPVKTIPPVI